MLKLKFYPDITVGSVGSTQGTSGISGGPTDPKMDQKDIDVFKGMGGTDPQGASQIAANGLSIKRDGNSAYLVFKDENGKSQCVKLEKDTSGLQAQILKSDGSYQKVTLKGGNPIQGSKNFDFDKFLDGMIKMENPTQALAKEIGLNPESYSTQDHITIQDGKTTKIITEEKEGVNAKTVYIANDKDGDGKINNGEKVQVREYDVKGNIHYGVNGDHQEFTLDKGLEIELKDMRSQENANAFKNWWDKFSSQYFNSSNAGQ